MIRRVLDTSPEIESLQRSAHERLGAAGRVRVAMELSEAVRSIHMDGIRRRNPGWDEQRVVRKYIEDAHGIIVPDSQ